MKRKNLFVLLSAFLLLFLGTVVFAQETTKLRLSVDGGDLKLSAPGPLAELNFGSFPAAFNTGYLSGTFGVSAGIEIPFFVEDFFGTSSGWYVELTLNSTAVMDANSNGISKDQFTIALATGWSAGQYPVRYMSGDSTCGITGNLVKESGVWSANGATNTMRSAGTTLSNAATLFRRPNSNGKVCTYGAKPKVMVRIPMNQPAGTYTGVMTFNRQTGTPVKARATNGVTYNS